MNDHVVEQDGHAKLFFLNGNQLTIEDVHQICSDKCCTVHIDADAKKRITNARQVLENAVATGDPIYGVTTGYGEMVPIFVSSKHECELQTNLILSHSVGVGEHFSSEETRSMLVARINAFCKGYSGVRIEIVDRLTNYLNVGVCPVVPKIGSLGASGDLAPLAHIAATLIGHGEMLYGDQRLSTQQCFNKIKLEPLKLKYKDGLSLINGTSAMTGIAALTVYNAISQVRQAEAIAALALEVLEASASAYNAKGHDLARPHMGQIDSAANIRLLIRDSDRIRSHESLCLEMGQGHRRSRDATDTGVFLQKAYTIRCIPQVIGAVRDTLYHAKKVVEIELNSANDNPLFFEEDDDVFHGGNFHGQPVAFVMDFSSIALTQLGNFSERRTNRLLNKHLNNGLPEFLVKGTPGLSCGFAGAQYTATAMASENRSLCSPCSIQNIPSNGDNQDVVSMGLTSARRTAQILANNQYILAVEWIAAAQAADIAQCTSELSTAGKISYNLLRKSVSTLEQDRIMSNDIEQAAALLQIGSLDGALKKADIHLR